jgi:hypothetical protein
VSNLGWGFVTKRVFGDIIPPFGWLRMARQIRRQGWGPPLFERAGGILREVTPVFEPPVASASPIAEDAKSGATLGSGAASVNRRGMRGQLLREFLAGDQPRRKLNSLRRLELAKLVG